jgi:hypothetical protein
MSNLLSSTIRIRLEQGDILKPEEIIIAVTNTRERTFRGNARILLNSSFVVDVIRRIGFIEKISKIRWMSSNLMVKHPDCCGPSNRPEIVPGDLAFYLPGGFGRTQPGLFGREEHKKEVSGVA